MDFVFGVIKQEPIDAPGSSSVSAHYDPALTELDKAIELAKKTRADAELIQSLLRTKGLIRRRDDFTLYCTTRPSQTCQEIQRKTTSYEWQKVYAEGKTTWNLMPYMMTGALEGQFLKSLVSLQKAKRILDIGMFSGYSALSMAEALPEDGELVTIDQDEYLKTFVLEATKSSPHGYKINILIGNALDLMAQMVENGDKFDIIFLDADKNEYVDYFKFAFERNLLKPDGTVLVDNSYFFGEWYTDNQSSAKKFADAVVAKSLLHSVLVPIRDGIMMVRRLSHVDGAVRGL